MGPWHASGGDLLDVHRTQEESMVNGEHGLCSGASLDSGFLLAIAAG